MVVTASTERAISAPSTPVRAFLAARRAPTALSATVIVGALTAWIGRYAASLPSAVESGAVGVPLWRMLAMGAAVAPVMSLHSRLADLELMATRCLRRQQRIYLAGMSLGCMTGYLCLSAITLSPPVLAVIARSWLAWYGLALIAGVCVGWRLAWTLPVAIAGILFYWGYHGSGQYAWWEFSARPYDDVPSFLLSVALFAAGLTAYWATPWRRRRCASWVRRARAPRLRRDRWRGSPRG